MGPGGEWRAGHQRARTAKGHALAATRDGLDCMVHCSHMDSVWRNVSTVPPEQTQLSDEMWVDLRR